MQKHFREQIGHNLKVYVGDIIIKSCMVMQLIDDLEETFSNLHESPT